MKNRLLHFRLPDRSGALFLMLLLSVIRTQPSNADDRLDKTVRSQDSQGQPVDSHVKNPIDDTTLETTADLLRGFSDAELEILRQRIPARDEPTLRPPRPRLTVINGVVFDDRNANGRRESNEPGHPGISVTDGERVMTTDDAGRFRFSIRFDETPHHRFIAMTRPTGFRTTTDFFQRIPYDEPRATYQLEFGIAVDPASAKDRFWFMTASDSQFNTLEQMVPTAKDYGQITSAPAIKGFGAPAFLVTAGDLTMNGTQYEWDMYDYIRGQSRIPVYEGFGGHDGNCLDPRCTVSFEQRIGPPYYSWDFGGVHFLQLVAETNYLRTPARERQTDWLKADLQSIPEGQPVIAVSHYPLDTGWFDQRRDEGVHVIGQIGAHWHVVQAGSRNSVPVLNSAPARGRDWGAYSRTYRWVFVTPDGIRSRLRVAGQYGRLELLAPGKTTRTGRQTIVVLAYDSAREVRTLSGTATDPAGVSHQLRFTPHGDWSWYSEFDPQLAGLWTFSLNATDATGTNWQTAESIEVIEAPLFGTPETSDFSTILSGQPPRNVQQGPQPPLQLRWVTPTGAVHVLHNSPVIADGRVFITVGNPNAHSPGAGLLCLDLLSGKTLWKAPSPHGDIRGSAAVHGHHVFAITGDGHAVAWNCETGDQSWSVPLRADANAGRPLAINNSPPVPTTAGLLVSDWQKPQFLLDFMTGKTLKQLSGDTGYYASFATVFDGIMHSVRRGGGSAIRIADGKTLYEFDEACRSTSAPIVDNGQLIYNGSNGLRVRDAATGELIWQRGIASIGYQSAMPVIWKDRILVNGTNPVLLDRATGEVVTTIPCGRDVSRFHRSRRQSLTGSSAPVIAGNHAWFGHDDTSIRGIDYDGRIVWERRLGTPIKTALAISGQLLLVHDFAGNLWCFQGSLDIHP